MCFGDYSDFIVRDLVLWKQRSFIILGSSVKKRKAVPITANMLTSWLEYILSYRDELSVDFCSICIQWGEKTLSSSYWDS